MQSEQSAGQSAAQPSAQVFAGLKVLAVARVYAAPFAAYQLALHGADVIHVEEPLAGDTTRTGGGAHAKAFTDAKMGTAFLAHAANKRSLTLNLREPEAQEAFRKLARDADIVIENLRTGDMERYGLSYETLRAQNPRLIYGSLTGYGQTGPKKRDAAIDMVVQAGSGMMSITGTEESGPVRSGTTVVDYLAGFSLTVALVTALYQRTQTGLGQRLDVAMLESALAGMSAIVSDVQNAGFVPRLMGNRSSTNTPISNTLKCSEGYIMVAASNDRRRRRILEAIGRMDILDDSRFATVELMRQNYREMYAEIERTLAARTAHEWEGHLNKAGVPCMRVASLPEAVDCEQIRERRFYHTFDSAPGVAGKLTVPLAPYKMSMNKPLVHSPPPLLGQHTDEILRGAGYTEADISRMRGAGII